MKLTINRAVLPLVLLLVCCVMVGCGPRPVGVKLKYRIVPSASGNVSSATMADLIAAVNRRVGRAGKAHSINGEELVVEVYGAPEREELEQLKRLLAGAGLLEFRILADTAHPSDQPLIKAAEATDVKQSVVELDGKPVGEWISLSSSDQGQAMSEFVTRKGLAGPEVFVLADTSNVTGNYLESATAGHDEAGHPCVEFSFLPEGAAKLEDLTSHNLPDATSGARRHLGIILDKQLLASPTINSTISKRGMISGPSDKVVSGIVEVLKAGAYPCQIEFVEQTVVGMQP